MADIIRGEPGDLCDGESAACHSALEQLRGVFLNIGFNAEKKRDREATLRVYPSKDVHHPLLNPRFRRCSIDGVYSGPRKLDHLLSYWGGPGKG